MLTIAIANQKGGVGKTTTAVNLSTCLAEKNVRTLLIDLDPQANATSAIGLEGIDGQSIYEPLMGSASVVEKILPSRFEHLFVLPADLDLAGAEIEVARLDDHLLRLRHALAPLKEDTSFDFAILDCPPSLGILMTNALAAADELLVPIQCEYFALEGLSKISHVIGQIKSSGANPNLALAEEVRKHFGETVYKTLIPRSIRLGEAPSFGKPIIEYEPGGVAAEAYRAMTKEFLQRHGITAG
jgi:chromosome partitioning protein